MSCMRHMSGPADPETGFCTVSVLDGSRTMSFLVMLGPERSSKCNSEYLSGSWLSQASKAGYDRRCFPVHQQRKLPKSQSDPKVRDVRAGLLRTRPATCSSAAGMPRLAGLLSWTRRVLFGLEDTFPALGVMLRRLPAHGRTQSAWILSSGNAFLGYVGFTSDTYVQAQDFPA